MLRLANKNCSAHNKLQRAQINWQQFAKIERLWSTKIILLWFSDEFSNTLIIYKLLFYRAMPAQQGKRSFSLLWLNSPNLYWQAQEIIRIIALAEDKGVGAGYRTAGAYQSYRVEQHRALQWVYACPKKGFGYPAATARSQCRSLACIFTAIWALP